MMYKSILVSVTLPQALCQSPIRQPTQVGFDWQELGLIQCGSIPKTNPDFLMFSRLPSSPNNGVTTLVSI